MWSQMQSLYAVMDSTVLGLARVNSSRARLLHKQLCSMGEAAGILNRTHCSVQNATAGERLAKQVCNAVTQEEHDYHDLVYDSLR